MFGDEFNKWLIEQGKEPVSPELIEALNRAGVQVAQELRENREQIVRDTQEFMAGFAEAFRRAASRR